MRGCTIDCATQRRSRLRAAVTLLEVLLSLTLGLGVIFLLLTVFGGVSGQFEKGSSARQMTALGRVTQEMIQRDLSRLSPQYPVSYGQGDAGRGVDFLGGRFAQWPTEERFALSFSAQCMGGAPSDQLGFFLTLSPEEAVPYAGKALAHVLYFTALTPGGAPEKLGLTPRETQRGFSRKLLRLYTPPDRLFERLNMIDPASSYGDYPRRGIAGVPRGFLQDSKGTVRQDDRDWYAGTSPSPAVLSLVAEGVLSFRVEPKGVVCSENEDGSTVRFESLGELSQLPSLAKLSLSSPRAYHEAVRTARAPQFRTLLKGAAQVSLSLASFSFEILLCPPQQAKGLRPADWEKGWPLSPPAGTPALRPTLVSFSVPVQR